MSIQWFRVNAAQKLIKSPKPPSVPKAPKAPKSVKPKTPKKIIGPKSPMGFKKKLYIPKKFIMAADGSPGLDMSSAAIANLIRYMYSGDLKLSHVEWVNPTPSHRCQNNRCNELNGALPIYDLSELAGGITSMSHPGCDCHIVVTLDNGETFRVTTDDDMAHLQWVGTPQRPADEMIGDEFIAEPEQTLQERWLGEEGFSEVKEGEEEEEFL